MKPVSKKKTPDESSETPSPDVPVTPPPPPAPVLRGESISTKARETLELIKRKQQGKPVERVKEREPAKVIDLMEALRRSAGEKGGARRPTRRAASHSRAKKPSRTAARHRKAG